MEEESFVRNQSEKFFRETKTELSDCKELLQQARKELTKANQGK